MTLTPVQRQIAELLLRAESPRAMATILKKSPEIIRRHMHAMYVKFDLCGDGLCVPRVKLALLIHERRQSLRVQCQACGDKAVVGPVTIGRAASHVAACGCHAATTGDSRKKL